MCTGKSEPSSNPQSCSRRFRILKATLFSSTGNSLSIMRMVFAASSCCPPPSVSGGMKLQRTAWESLSPQTKVTTMKPGGSMTRLPSVTAMAKPLASHNFSQFSASILETVFFFSVSVAPSTEAILTPEMISTPLR